MQTADDGVDGHDGTGPLVGKSFVLTGRLATMSRPEAEEKLRRAGATVNSSVSKKTSFVVVGEEAGSKADRAKELKVPILNEEELTALINAKPGTIASENGSASGNV